jgi:tripartite-type tricarboxylate transporter receptor subunit TctC
MLAGFANAQSWPEKQPIRVILPFSPGSSLDTLGRPVFEHVAKQIGQSLVFEHRPGAGGTLGMTQVAKAEADGYTLLLNSSVQTITPSTYTLAFDVARDFAGIAPLAQFPNVLVVPLSGFKTVADLVAAGKAKPGSLTFGSGGVGAATHLTAERFMLSAGIKAVHVPFKGAPDVLREILGGRLDFYFSPLASAMPLIESKQLRALAVSSVQRSPSLPDISRSASPIRNTCSGSAPSHRRRPRAILCSACMARSRRPSPIWTFRTGSRSLPPSRCR